MWNKSSGVMLRGAGVAALTMLLAAPLWAQAQANKRPEDDRALKTFYLKNAAQQNDANEILVALRNVMDPSTKIYLVANQNAIVVRATPADFALAEKLISDLDRPRKSWRLTYTLTEKDGAKTVGARHFSMVVASGQNATLKNGSKVPVMTGTYKEDIATQEQQFTYLDVGTNFDATLTEVGDGAQLKSKVEQSSISDEKSSVGLQDPLVRQTVLAGVVMLTPGKPLALGVLDVPGTTHSMEISVEMEPVK